MTATTYTFYYGKNTTKKNTYTINGNETTGCTNNDCKIFNSNTSTKNRCKNENGET